MPAYRIRLALALVAIAPLQLALAQSAKTASVSPVTASIDTLLNTPGPPWITTRSSHFILHLERTAQRTSARAMIDSLETAWEHAIDLLGSPTPTAATAQVFVTASRTRFAGLVAPDARGLTTRLPQAGTIVILVRNDSVRPYIQHEVMHVASYAAWGPPQPALAWLAEGLASFADGRCQNSTIRAVGRDLLAARPDITADRILHHFVDLWRTERAVSYVVAGTFVDYLWASRGSIGVRRLWQSQDDLSDVGPLPGVGGELTATWRQYVAQVAGSTAGIELASLARDGCG